MNLQLLQEAVAAKVRLIPLLAGLPVREEQLGNIIETVQNDVLKTRFCVVVGSATFSDEAPDSATCYGLTRIEVSIFEDPEFNRAQKNRPTCLAAAQAIAQSLKLFRPDAAGAGVLTSPVISETKDLGEGIISLTVSLTAKISL